LICEGIYRFSVEIDKLSHILFGGISIMDDGILIKGNKEGLIAVIKEEKFKNFIDAWAIFFM